MEIVEFILSRIAEDELLALEAVDGMWAEALSSPHDDADPVARFMGQWTPWRVFSMCVLGRRLVAEHRMITDRLGRASCASCDPDGMLLRWPCPTLMLLADEWNHDPAFEVEWTAARRALRRIS